MPCGCWAYWHIARELKAAQNELDKICQEFNGAHAELTKLPLHQSTTGYGDQQTFDQYGHPLLQMLGEDPEDGRGGVVCPIWPPRGLNIIL